jgi:hypothetical protein
MKLNSLKKFRLILIWFVTACLVFPLSSAIAKKGGNHKTQVKVMTRNLYLGADIFKVVEAAQNDPGQSLTLLQMYFKQSRTPIFMTVLRQLPMRYLKPSPMSLEYKRPRLIIYRRLGTFWQVIQFRQHTVSSISILF